MSEKNETNVKIIENASLDDVVPGDYLIWECVSESGGVTDRSIREGIAHSQDMDGEWYSKEDVWITDHLGDSTLTIRRPVKELPTKPGSVIAAADGREYIEAKTEWGVYRAREAVFRADGFWLAAWRTDDQGRVGYITSDRITLGTWKVDGE